MWKKRVPIVLREQRTIYPRADDITMITCGGGQIYFIVMGRNLKLEA